MKQTDKQEKQIVTVAARNFSDRIYKAMGDMIEQDIPDSDSRLAATAAVLGLTMFNEALRATNIEVFGVEQTMQVELAALDTVIANRKSAGDE